MGLLARQIDFVQVAAQNPPTKNTSTIKVYIYIYIYIYTYVACNFCEIMQEREDRETESKRDTDEDDRMGNVKEPYLHFALAVYTGELG